MNSPLPTQLHVVEPRATRTFDTPFGPGGVTAGTDDKHGVILKLTPAAADQLARIISGSSTMRDADVDEQSWISVMIDLLSCSAAADGLGPAPRMVRLTGAAS